MAMTNRRTWLRGLAAGALGAIPARAGAAGEGPSATCAPKDGRLLLQDFRPESMLHVAETRVEKPRFPAIDVHAHLTSTDGWLGWRRYGRRGRLPHDTRAGPRGHGPQGHPGHGQPHRRHGPRAREGDRDLRPRPPRSLLHLHRADLRRVPRPALPAAPGRRHRARRARGCARPEDRQDPRALPPRGAHRGASREGRRPAVRPHVGGLRRPHACPSSSTSPIPRPSSGPWTAGTSAGTSSATIPTGPSTEGTSRATRT